MKTKIKPWLDWMGKFPMPMCIKIFCTFTFPMKHLKGVLGTQASYFCRGLEGEKTWK